MSPRRLQRELSRFATLHRANRTLITAKNPGPQGRTFDLKYLAAIHALRMNHTFDYDNAETIDKTVEVWRIPGSQALKCPSTEQ